VRQHRRLGFTTLVAALSLTAFAHLGFFSYAVVLLVVEAVYYGGASRVWQGARPAAAAVALALVVSLPVTFELFRYPSEFNFNNVLYERPSIDWFDLARRIGYNVDVLVSPARWFSDTTKLFGPLVLLVAWRREGREGFYAWAAIVAVAMGLLNVPQAGYVFARPASLLLILTPVALAAFITSRSANSWQAAALAALVILTIPIAGGFAVPHQPSVHAFAPGLVERIRRADGALVLLENNPHRGVTVGGQTARSLYGTHYEALVPAATGKRLYAGYWDGWQWTPFRGEMLAGGGWQGHVLGPADRDAFVAEMTKWGVRNLFVWTDTAKGLISSWPEFEPVWSDGPWRQFVLRDAPADPSSVVTSTGRGELIDRDALGGIVRLTSARKAERVVVRTHFHPSWRVFGPRGEISAAAVDGQLAFETPADGDYDVRLVYPARRGLLAMSGIVLGLVVAWDAWKTGTRSRSQLST
jgi:hypothetical protein